MTRHFEASTLDDLIRYAVESISSEGTPITPTKGSCSEIAAATFELTNPRARLSRSATRGRLFSALGELCWYLSGSDKTDDIAYYIKHYDKLDENGSIFGAYGPRLFAFDGVNQIEYVIQTLRHAQASRRTVIQLFDHQDVSEQHKDIPCTCTLQYMLREGHLSAITYMRSNDVFRGLPHDIFCFTMLQELIARSVGAELGSYHHMVGSLHMYDQDIQSMDAFVAEGWQATTQIMPAMPTGDPWPEVHRLLNVERQLRNGAAPDLVDLGTEPYWADLGRLLCLYAASSSQSVVELIKSAMSNDYYDIYINDRIDRLSRSAG